MFSLGNGQITISASYVDMLDGFWNVGKHRFLWTHFDVSKNIYRGERYTTCHTRVNFQYVICFVLLGHDYRWRIFRKFDWSNASLPLFSLHVIRRRASPVIITRKIKTNITGNIHPGGQIVPQIRDGLDNNRLLQNVSGFVCLLPLQEVLFNGIWRKRYQMNAGVLVFELIAHLLIFDIMAE